MDENVRNVPFFSIVMPAYGVEKYISAAVEGIQKQTFERWELIIVDDCSVDGTGKIAETFRERDQRIRVFHHEKNQGLSAARNTGMYHAYGKYIWFMDPDDRVEEDLLELVYGSVQKNPAKLVVFGLIEEYYKPDGTFSYQHVVQPEEHYFKTAQELRPYIIRMEQDTLYGYAWNKMYDLSYLKQIHLRYENLTLIEDIAFNVKYCMDIDSMNTLAVAPYHYAKRLEGSLTNRFVPDYFKLHKDRIEMIFDQHQYWNICTSEVKSILGSLYARYILSAMQRNCDPRAKMKHSARYRWCRALFCQPLFNELIPRAKARDSRMLSLWLMLLRWKRSMLCLAMGRTVYLIKNKMPMIYSHVKSGR